MLVQPTLTTLLIFVSLGINAVLIACVIYLNIRIGRLLIGKNARSLEDSIINAQKDISDLQTFEDESVKYFEHVEARLKRAIQSVETVRFNPFKGTGEGGNQSFATSFTNEKGDGVVISSLYSRERVSIFSKPLKNFESQFELTDEEQEVVHSSIKHLRG